MTLTTLTEGERRWQQTARKAVERNEEWEACDECLRFHPADFEGDCDDKSTRLPLRPQQLVA